MANITLGKRNAAILSGENDLSTWTDDELRRGQQRDKNGRWPARKPKVVPKVLHDELVRRQYDEASQILRSSLVDAVTLFHTIVMDPEAESAVRLKAAQVIVERVMGKAQQNVKLDVGVKAKWEEAIAHSIVPIPAELADAIETGSWDSDDDREGQFTEPE